MGKWEKVSGRVVYSNAYYTVVEDVVTTPDGKDGTYSVVRKGPFVIVIAIENDKAYFIKQFRYPTQQEGWELIKGGCDGQNVLEAAQKELHEEAGLRAGCWEEIGAIESANSYLDEIGHVVVATDIQVTADNKQAEEGITECAPLSKSEYLAKIKSGEIHDGHTIAALYLAEAHGFIE